jgi:thiamine transport system substrate-binding protein
MKSRILITLLALSLLLAACQPAEAAKLTVMTHDSFAVSEAVIAAFEEENNAQVEFLAAGDAGAVLNKAILTRSAPLADVLYGLDNTFLSRALEADLFEAYDSPLLAKVPEAFRLDPENRAIPVDYADVCINYDRAYFTENRLSIPASLEDLLRPEYNSLLVVENPSTSSPGLAFLMASVAVFGDPGYLEFWSGLRDNGVVVVDGWDTAYYTNFSASSGRGPQPMVVSYASSPAAEVVFADPPVTEPPTASVLSPGTCFRQVEFAGILRGTQNRSLAERFIDFLLDVQFQQDLPLQMFVYPVNPEAVVPQVFSQWAGQPVQPATLDAETIRLNRERWIQAWSEVMFP